MIERILITNLPRRPERRWMALGALVSKGYPIDKITFFKCHDVADYEDHNAAHHAAVADGFPFIVNEPMTNCVSGFMENGIIWLWTWLSLLRGIVNSNEITLLLIDDRPPSIGWERMNLMTSEVHNESFCGIQLDIVSDFLFCHFNLDIQPVTSSCGKRFIAWNDCGFVLSPRGANLLLKEHAKNPSLPPYEIIFRRTEPGFFHVLTNVCTTYPKNPSDWSR